MVNEIQRIVIPAKAGIHPLFSTEFMTSSISRNRDPLPQNPYFDWLSMTDLQLLPSEKGKIQGKL